MWKLTKFLWGTAFVLALLLLGALLADKQAIQDSFIRMHVRANSNSREDQMQKLAVRDRLLEYICDHAGQMSSKEAAQAFLQQNLDKIQTCANAYLAQSGSENRAKVSLRSEAFATRDYADFSLPAGVYEALVVEIGSGEGENWWCVVFPSLCLQDFHAAAVSADLNDGLESTLTRDEGYEIRFFLLECLGKLENFFHKS